MKETRRPRPAPPGAAGSYDYEYERNGVSNLFMLFAPLEGWRRVEVTDRRTKADWARVVKQLVDEDYPHKDRIVLVMDNLNTHVNGGGMLDHCGGEKVYHQGSSASARVRANCSGRMSPGQPKRQTGWGIRTGSGATYASSGSWEPALSLLRLRR